MKKILYTLVLIYFAFIATLISRAEMLYIERSKINFNHLGILLFHEMFLGFLVSCIIGLTIYLYIQEMKEKKKLIHHLHDAENKQHESDNKIRESETKAIEASRSKTMFLAIAGHELRTPLIGIIGLAEVLRKSKLPEQETNFSDNIYYSSKALLKTLNNTLEYAKIESGKIELENAEFDLPDFINQIISILYIKAQEKKISLNYYIDKNVPKKLFGDSSRLSQVIYNLLGNAIKFTAVGSVILKIKVLAIDPSNCLHLHFLIEDTGIGIGIEQQQKLFLPFNIIQSKRTREDDGSGLGLAISMQLAKAMGGEIHVTSELGKGSCFSFITIFSHYSHEKVGEIEQTQGIGLAEHNEITPIFSGQDSPTILIVDDNQTNLLMAQAILEKLGAKTIIATNGKEALYENSQSKIDLILMDCQMPVMDGFATTRELRKQHVTTPILAMTAYTGREDQENCSNAGMNGFVAKPISIRLLSNELKKELGTFVIS